MAKLETVITADIHPIEKAFAEIKAKAKELGEGIKDVGSDLGKGLTGVSLEKILGVGGAIYAAGKLQKHWSTPPKRDTKRSKFIRMPCSNFKYNLPSAAGSLEERGQMGKEMAETAESKVGIFSFTN